MSSLTSESDFDSDQISDINKATPSGLSNLFKQNKEEVRPLNAFIVTSKVPPIYHNNSDYDYVASSLKSSSYYTASIGQETTADNHSEYSEESEQPMPSPLAQYPNYLSRTVSSTNYFDNQSDYEVILDDGTRQKRTISLSTLQQVPSRYNNMNQASSGNFASFFNKWMNR